jgi:hypothetical protein
MVFGLRITRSGRNSRQLDCYLRFMGGCHKDSLAARKAAGLLFDCFIFKENNHERILQPSGTGPALNCPQSRSKRHAMQERVFLAYNSVKENRHAV